MVHPCDRSRLIVAASTTIRGRPSVLPFALALRSPARTHSAINDRSNSATAPRTVNTILPTGVLVSICSLRVTKAMPSALKVSSARSRWDTERANLSNFQTTTASNWQRCATILTLNTTMRGRELKGFRWRDISLINATLTIERSKTEAGERVIPLNRDAMAAVLELYKRAQGLGATDLNRYVFPACENEKIEPTRPQTTWRTAWRKLTSVVQCPTCSQLQNPADKCRNDGCGADIHELKSPLAKHRFHDLRHHAITELAESQASEQTIMSIAGHVSSKMLAHYSHVRLDAKCRALDALGGRVEGSHVTNHVTKGVSGGGGVRKLLINMVGPCGLEPQTSTVSRWRSSQLSYGPTDWKLS